MRKIYVDETEDSRVNTIAWVDRDGQEECLQNKDEDCNSFDIHSSVGENLSLYKADIDKVIKALQLAKKHWT